jgi:hypothetical protein
MKGIGQLFLGLFTALGIQPVGARSRVSGNR